MPDKRRICTDIIFPTSVPKLGTEYIHDLSSSPSLLAICFVCVEIRRNPSQASFKIVWLWPWIAWGFYNAGRWFWVFWPFFRLVDRCFGHDRGVSSPLDQAYATVRGVEKIQKEGSNGHNSGDKSINKNKSSNNPNS